jgi:hypothetical protein
MILLPLTEDGALLLEKGGSVPGVTRVGNSAVFYLPCTWWCQYRLVLGKVRLIHSVSDTSRSAHWYRRCLAAQWVPAGPVVSNGSGMRLIHSVASGVPDMHLSSYASKSQVPNLRCA